MTAPATPLPVTGTVIAKDLAERAVATFVQAAIPSLILVFSATSLTQAKSIGLAAAAAGGAAVLSLVKGLMASYVTGTASFAKQVAESSSSTTPPPSSDVYGGGQALGGPLAPDDGFVPPPDDDGAVAAPELAEEPLEPDHELTGVNLADEQRQRLAGTGPSPDAAT